MISLIKKQCSLIQHCYRLMLRMWQPWHFNSLISYIRTLPLCLKQYQRLFGKSSRISGPRQIGMLFDTKRIYKWLLKNTYCRNCPFVFYISIPGTRWRCYHRRSWLITRLIVILYLPMCDASLLKITPKVTYEHDYNLYLFICADVSWKCTYIVASPITKQTGTQNASLSLRNNIGHLWITFKMFHARCRLNP